MVHVAAVGSGHHSGETNYTAPAEERNVAAVNITDIVEYDAGNSTVSTQSTSSDRGGQAGGRFGPRRAD